MNRQYSKKQLNNKPKVVVFWSMIGVITITFILSIVLMMVNSREISSYQEMDNVVRDGLFTQEEVMYFVYVYGSNTNATEKADYVNPTIFNYLNFVKLNSRKDGVMKMYGLDIDYFENRSALSDAHSSFGISTFAEFKVNKNELPIVLVVDSGRIVDRRVKEQEIEETLQDAIKEVVQVSFPVVAITNRKEMGI